MGEWPYTAESSGIVSGVLPPDMVIECTFSFFFTNNMSRYKLVNFQNNLVGADWNRGTPISNAKKKKGMPSLRLGIN